MAGLSFVLLQWLICIPDSKFLYDATKLVDRTVPTAIETNDPSILFISIIKAALLDMTG